MTDNPAADDKPISSGADEAHAGEPKRSQATTLIGLAVIAALLMVYLLAENLWLGAPSRAGTDHPAVGTPLGLLQLDPLAGVEDGLQREDLAGKVTMINYWGPWCGYCLQEFPHLVELHKGLADEPDFQLVSVSCRASEYQSIPELKEDTQEQLSSSGAQFGAYIDTSGASRQSLMMLANLRQFGLPVTMLVDRQGVIRAYWEGYLAGDERQVEAVTRALLAEK